MSFDPSKLSLEEQNKLKDNIADLRKKLALYTRGDKFEVGDIVTFKKGLQNRRYPRPGSAGIVTRILPVPIFDSTKTEAGSPYFNEQLDICVGLIDLDGDFIEFTFDSKRLERVSGDQITGKHFNVVCDGCRKEEFTGIRFHCTECSDFDLCPQCQAEGAEPGNHSSNHKMIAIEPSTEPVLRERLKSLLEINCFQPGDIVQWKSGLKNKRLPEADQFAVVVEMLPVPVTDEDKSAAGSCFLEPLDMKLGIIDDDGDFLVFHYDSRRFTKAM